MTRWMKFFMILMTIISFSSGVVGLSAMFVSSNPQGYLLIGISSFLLSHSINREIIAHEDRISEQDETF